MKSKSIRNLNIVFAVLWMVILFCGVVFKITNVLLDWPASSKITVEENRKLATWPKFNSLPANQYGKSLNNWYNDNFPWRQQILEFYRYLTFRVLKSPHGQQVPGRGNWIFRRGGTWPELDDYIGCVNVDDKMLDEWRTLIEGRVAWAEAIGSHFLEVITPMKIQVHEENALFLPKHVRGFSAREQLEDYIESSFAKTNIVICDELLKAEVKSGKTVFYEDDHHVNAYGCYLIYREINRRIRDLWYSDTTDVPFFENPPPDVIEGKTRGCYSDRQTQRLHVVVPGSERHNHEALCISTSRPHYPSVSVYIEQPGADRFIIFAHDSFLRFPLSSWRFRPPRGFAIPLGDGFNRIAMLIFTRLYSSEYLDLITEKEIPNVIIEQFPEGKIIFGAVGYDETMRKAAEFGRADPVGKPDSGTYKILAVFENVKAASENEAVTAEIRDAAGTVIATEPIRQGVRRAVFFGDVPVNGKITASVSGGTATLSRLEYRK